MPNLYEINENLRLLLEEVPETGEVDDEWIARYAESQGDLKQKLEGIMVVRQEALTRSAGLKFEMDRLKAQMESENKLAVRMETYLDSFMQMDGKTEIKTDRFMAKYKKNPPAYEYDETAIAQKFVELKMPELKAKVDEANEEFKKWKEDEKEKAKNEATEMIGKKAVVKPGTYGIITITQKQRLDIK